MYTPPAVKGKFRQVCRVIRKGATRFALLAFLGVASLSAQEAVRTRVYPSAAEIDLKNAIARRNGAIVYYSLAPEQVQELTRAAAAGAVGPYAHKLSELAARIGIPKDVAVTLLRIIARADVAIDQLPQKLTEVVDRYRRTEDELIGVNPEERVALRLVERARAMIAAGDFGKTHQLLAEAKQELTRVAEQADAPHQRMMLFSVAQLSSAEGYLAKTELHYLQAANLFKEAANLIARESARLSYLAAEAESLYLQGKEFGDTDALVTSIELRKRLLEQRVVTHVDIGDALEALGERESGTARLEDAVTEYRAALIGWTRPIER